VGALDGKVALITGVGENIGLATALASRAPRALEGSDGWLDDAKGFAGYHDRARGSAGREVRRASAQRPAVEARPQGS
jgi:hypothetical protein